MDMSLNIPPATRAALQLSQDLQTGAAQATTPQGIPTVVSRLVQRALPPQSPHQLPYQSPHQMPPSMQQVAQQAGLGNQIQQQKMQQAQQAMMQQAMSQQPAGIEGLNPNIGGFADGGIVGYAGDDESYISDPAGTGFAEATELAGTGQSRKNILERIIMAAFAGEPEWKRQAREERRLQEAKPAPAPAPAPSPPPAPPTAPPRSGEARPSGISSLAPGLATSSAADIAKALGFMPTQVTAPSPQDQIRMGLEQKNTMEQYLRQAGIDPQLLQNQINQATEFYGRREAAIRKREEEETARAPQEGIIERLLGYRGRTFGEAMGAGATRGRTFDEAMRQRIQGLQDLQMDLEGLKLDRVNKLKEMQYNTAMGYFDKAIKDKNDLDAINRNIGLKNAELSMESAKIKSGEVRTAAELASQQATRAQAAQFQKEGKLEGQLAANLRNYEQIAKDVDQKFKDDPRVKAWQAMSTAGKPTPEIDAAYSQAMTDRKNELDIRGSGIKREIDRLQGMIYGVGAIKTDASPSAGGQFKLISVSPGPTR